MVLLFIIISCFHFVGVVSLYFCFVTSKKQRNHRFKCLNESIFERCALPANQFESMIWVLWNHNFNCFITKTMVKKTTTYKCQRVKFTQNQRGRDVFVLYFQCDGEQRLRHHTVAISVRNCPCSWCRIPGTRTLRGKLFIPLKLPASGKTDDFVEASLVIPNPAVGSGLFVDPPFPDESSITLTMRKKKWLEEVIVCFCCNVINLLSLLVDSTLYSGCMRVVVHVVQLHQNIFPFGI